jgi:lysophospholipase L1-like esterase
MPVNNVKNQPLLLVGLTIAMLLLLTSTVNEASFFGYKIVMPDLFMDIRKDIQEQEQIVIEKETEDIDINSLTERFSVAEASNPVSNFISLLLNFSGNEKLKNPNSRPTVVTRTVPISGNVSQMKHFSDAVKNAKIKNVRIAHYGDSAIEGDLISADLREELQSLFGGKGAGYLSITSQDISFRTTTKHSFSNDWKTAAIATSNPDRLLLGIDGSVSIPKSASSWVKYEATGRHNVTSFNQVRIFYSNAKKSSIKYSINNGAEQSAELTPGSDVKQLILKTPNAKSIKITAGMAEQAHFYGVSLDSGEGIHVDNMPLRGNSGVDLRNITPGVMKEFNRHLQYNLIILNFGLNLIGEVNEKWYEREMSKVVEQFKTAFPQSSILIVGVGDKSTKKGSRFVTDPGVLKLIEAQENIAKKTGVAFWNLFEAMGGENSMNEWVNANPPLAFKDHTHINDHGAKMVAQLLSKAIIDQSKK